MHFLIILDNELKFETSIYSIEVYLMESNTLTFKYFNMRYDFTKFSQGCCCCHNKCPFLLKYVNENTVLTAIICYIYNIIICCLVDLKYSLNINISSSINPFINNNTFFSVVPAKNWQKTL